MRTLLHIIFCYLVILFLCVVPRVYAADLSFSIPSQVIEEGDTFALDVFLDTVDAEVNAVAMSVVFPAKLVSFVEYETQASPILFWIDKPIATENNAIVFSGIIPSGIESPHTRLVRLHFKAKQFGQGIFSMNDAQVLLHDGLGTQLSTATSSIHFVIKEQAPETKVVTSNTLYKDDESPNPFELVLLQDADLFDNQKFIVFDTEDTASGVSYFEVKEHLFDTYKEVTSPYLLRNQEPSKYLSVRAVDKAGNKYTAYLYPQTVRPGLSFTTVTLGILVICLLGMFSSKKARAFFGW
jgi:hypothetical protein